ncbi:MAG: TatD family hydrolase [Gemmatimonadales bacterium]
MVLAGLVDSHCHLADRAFDADREVVLCRARAAGVGAVVVVADGVDTAERCLALAARPGLFATAGVHPHRAAAFDAVAAERVDALLREPRVVAVGETGLDYHYDLSPRERQREAFAWHLARAAATGKPVVVHSREADEDTARLLADAPPGLTGVLHCFSAGPAVLDAALARGLAVSWSGMVTFRNWDARWALERVSDEALLVETDAPYLAPAPHRGHRNEPAHVALTAARLAELRGTTPERVAALTGANARRLFQLPDETLGEGS